MISSVPGFREAAVMSVVKLLCPECHGTGVFLGFLFMSPCSHGCKPPRAKPDDWDDEADGDWDKYCRDMGDD